MEDRTQVESIMRRISDAGQNLVSHREELRLGVVREKARAINTLKVLEPYCEEIARRKSSNMIVLLKYKAVGDGRLDSNAWQNLTEVRAIEFQNDIHVDIE